MTEQEPIASIEWGGDGVTHSRKADVVVGGRYVVGPEPTYIDGDPCDLVKPGMVGYINLIDADGDARFVDGTGALIGYVDPRHLTPAPDQPAEAPAIDDDLIAALAAAHQRAGSTRWPHSAMKELLASEPMQRLRAAWQAEVVADEDADVSVQAWWHRGVIAGLVREHDSALLGTLQERDEARAERDDLRSQLEAESTVQWAHRDTIEHLQATVERLRAAQPQLPDVGPVTRRFDGEFSEWVFQDGMVYEDRDLELDTPNGRAVHLARMLAIHRALLDAEAAGAGATTDDEVVAVAAAIGEASGDEDWPGKFVEYGPQAEAAIRALDAHRARSGQDGAR